jgi:glutamate/tyrosine decarboxylase-like PLP-dependent enzyme
MAFDQSENPRILEIAMHHAQAYLAGLDVRGVAPSSAPDALRRQMSKPLSDHGASAEDVIDDLVRDASPGLIGSAGGRFFGWVIGSTLPVAMAADWLTSAWDQNATLSACAPAAGIAEEIAGAWLKDLLGLPSESSFAFVTGCQMAHVTCLAAARGALLRKRGWDVGEQGLAGSPKIRILANEHRHGSIDRAAGLLGLGRSNVEPLKTDAVGKVEFDALHHALCFGGPHPTILALQAGDIATGAFDHFEELIPLAKAAGAWVHIDGAFGLWAGASGRYRHLIRGVELADSWATDGHKLLNVPFDCGYAFVAHPEHHKAALSLRASYLTHADDARDQIDWTPDWSRRARGFATYAALRTLGRVGVADLFDHYCKRANALARGIADLPGAEFVSEPVINQALVRFGDPRGSAAEADHDRRTDDVIAAINATGEAFFTGSTWRGRRVMRISVCSWRTSATDVDRAIAAVRGVLLSNDLDRERNPSP